jgi:cyclopropane-fatty-acyl-phospholipid synthase
MAMVSVILRKVLTGLIRKGSLRVEPYTGEAYTIGDGMRPACTVKFKDRWAEVLLALDPELALGELYMDGRLEMASGEIYDLLAVATSNLGRGATARPIVAWQKLRGAALRLRHGIDARRARVNAAHHYDLDARLYRLFLDRDLQYSCAYFERPGLGLDAAQLAKKRHIAAKLAIRPGERILDIGCGWGGLALYLAELCDAEVFGVTLAREQLQIARERAEDAGLAAKAQFGLQDYRRVQGAFDRVVSVGMFEHVGPKNYNVFFGRIAELLADDGVALVHTITHFGMPGATNRWVTKYIFPGGHIPALVEIAPAIARAGLIVADIETLREHYALTIAEWRARFQARRDEAKAIFGERFCRMWEFYLAASECAFRYQGYAVAQLVLVKRLDALPIVRDYVKQEENALRRKEDRRSRLFIAAE